jgi:hypothetical protein
VFEVKNSNTSLGIISILFSVLFLSIGCVSAAEDTDGILNNNINDTLVEGVDYIDIDVFGPKGDVDESLALDNWDCGAIAVLGVLNTVSETEVNFNHSDIKMHDFKNMSIFLDNNGFPNKIIKNASLNDLNPKNSIIQVTEKSYCTNEYCFGKTSHFGIYQGKEKDVITSQEIIIMSDGIGNNENYTLEQFKENFTGYAIIPKNKTVECGSLVTNTEEQKSIIGEAKKGNKIFDSYNTSNPKIKILATKITNGSHNNYEKADKIRKWVQNNIKYHNHYNTLHALDKLLDSKRGNCCENARLLAGLLRSVGIPAKFVHGKDCGYYEGHVWVTAYIKDKYQEIDGTHHKGIGTHNLKCKEIRRVDELTF